MITHGNNEVDVITNTMQTDDYADDVPEPQSATGHYPDPVWEGSASPHVAAQSAIGAEDVPEPRSATGHYPDPVWADGASDMDSGHDALAAGLALEKTPPVSPVEDSPTANVSNTFDPTNELVEPSDLPLYLKDADYSDEFDSNSSQAEFSPPAVHPVELTLKRIYNIVREVAVADSGDELYSAIRRDSEFQTKGHGAFGKRHFGLAFGLVLFTQESGRLGNVLRLMQHRDAEGFTKVFGEHAETLLSVTTAATAEQRLQPVAGQLLWDSDWVETFRRAGEQQSCQYAQNEETIEGQFRPMLDVAYSLGMTTDRALAMVYDRVVTRGLAGGLSWVVHVAGAFRTETQRQHALATLGHANISEFQATQSGLPVNGVFTPQTHAALVAAVRARGTMPLPTAGELTWRMADLATGTARHRLLRLRDSTNLTDTHFEAT